MTVYVNQLGGDLPRVGPPPEGEAVTVWALDTGRSVVAGHAVEEAAAVLDAAERERAGRLVRLTDRHAYLASHLGLRALLGAYLGQAPADVCLIREECPCCGGPHGRPAVAGGGLHFSLSHTAGVAYVAFAAIPVGVDVEGTPGAAVVTDVLSTLHPAETAELTALAEADRPVALGRLWARKEAVLKATGAGLARGVAEPYVGSGPTPARVTGWTLRDLPAPPDYAAAVALAGPEPIP
ncbi:4'-phosphopantetheinyl transferase family protein [Streptomyces cirratus]|uniref:4'-phosphopantetheinyl transferase family protein n=1 Tax=Streptomyces cirratus TaxID=68187 RepID=UPI00167E27F1|nr:4'-phosphopantetheinyl transferase superfamily protein [Streptomyces cirratus]